MAMTMKVAMHERHMVRKYLDKPIPADIVETLNDRIRKLNNDHGIEMKLITEDKSAFSTVVRLILAKGVRNYIILAGKEADDLSEKLGYASADIMLFAQTLGLNTWWVGGTFNRGIQSQVSPDDKVIGVVAIGYGATQGIPHKSKKPEEVSSYIGETPKWFKDGITAALLAPTALNRQPFNIIGDGNRVAITCEGGIFAGANLGLVKYHFEIGAGKEHFEWV